VAIPQVPKESIEAALVEFDTKLRDASEWSAWENNKAQLWVLVHNECRYPPKKIISMATGVPVNSFSGGPESNDYLGARGFTVSRLRDLPLGEIFDLILERYEHFRSSEPFGGNHEIRELFLKASQRLEQSEYAVKRKHLNVVASYGEGNWATIPWISILGTC
jgi:hypothetical protein